MNRAFTLVLCFTLAVAIPAGQAFAATTVIDGFTFLMNGSGVSWTDVYNGSGRIDIVIMGDGYLLADQSAFEAVMDGMVAELWEVEPYASKKCAFNVWSVRLVSPVSGIGAPFNDTPLHASLGTPSRYVTADRQLCEDVCVAAGLTGWDVIVVIANEPGTYAAWTNNGLVCTTSKYAWGVLLAHELGHVIGGLADEYDCYFCDGTDSNRAYDTATMGIPPQPNLTIYGTEASRASIPWTVEGWPIPTTSSNSCNCGHVGAWEGGGTYASGVFRPAEYCVMKHVCHYISAFCSVCESALRNELTWDCLPPVEVSDLVRLFEDDEKVQLLPPYVLDLLPEIRPPFPIPQPFPELIVFDLPPCWYCPWRPTLEEEIRIELTGFDTSEARILVYDELGRLAADGAGDGSRVTVEFKASRLHTYRAFLVAGHQPARGASLNASIFRDGVAVFP